MLVYAQITCVAGYTAINDVSTGDYQLLTSKWTIGKSFNRFAPLGPALVTAGDVPDSQDLDLRVTINGEVM